MLNDVCKKSEVPTYLKHKLLDIRPNVGSTEYCVRAREMYKIYITGIQRYIRRRVVKRYPDPYGWSLFARFWM